MISFKEYLEEKLILFDNGKKFGNALFLAGGAGSGKGYASENFMDLSSYKKRDVDEFKKEYLKLNQKHFKETGKHKWPELANLDLKNPNDVSKLHMFVRHRGTDDKTLNLLLRGKEQYPDRLPNIVFDVTGKSPKDYEETIPILLAKGYKPDHIHITWILTNYHIAVAQNKSRDRIVPDDIMLQTHEGAAHNMFSILSGNLPKGVDGDINVVLNNSDQTIKYLPSANAKKPDTTVIKGFTYLKVKRAGEPIQPKEEIKQKLYTWMKDNVPRTSKLKKLFAIKGAPSDEKANDNYLSNSAPKAGNQEQKNGPLLTIHRKNNNGSLGYAFRKKDGNIGFDKQEAQIKLSLLQKEFPGEHFTTIPYRPHNNRNY